MRTLTILLLAISTGLFAGGTQESDVNAGYRSTEQSFEAVTVTDIIGREVTIREPVERVAIMHFGTAEAMQILDAWDMVVARDAYTHDEALLPGVQELPVLNSPESYSYDYNMELLLGLDIDLMILEMTPAPGLEEFLKTLDDVIPAVVVKCHEEQALKDSLRIIGTLLDRTEEAEAYISWYNQVITTISKVTFNLSEEEKPDILLKFGTGAPDNLMTFSDEMSGVSYRNRITGSRNIAADLPSMGGWVANLDPEWVISQEIDILVINDPIPGAFGFSVTTAELAADHLEAVSSLPVFENSRAVKNDNAFILGDKMIGSPQFIIGYAYMAKWFHPHRFPDLDPQQLFQDYLTKFMRVDIDLEKQGVFVYPEGSRSAGN